MTRTLLACLVAVALAGCGGSQPPIGAPGPMPQTFARAAHADRGTSWMRSDGSSGNLLYVSDPGSENEAVYFYTYPAGVKVGQLTGLGVPEGLCADGTGNIFVTNNTGTGTTDVLEFAHGGTSPIRTLDDRGMEPVGCAISPVTGDLAVANYCSLKQSECEGPGNIVIYRDAKGSPRTFKDSAVSFFDYCGYDSAGELYADGITSKGLFALAGLPKDGKTLKQILVHWKYGQDIQQPGGVQWDGKLLAIGSAQGENLTPSVYRVDTLSWRVASALTLRKSQSVFQFFIDGNVLIAPNRRTKGGGQILFYTYPKGAKLSKVISGLDLPISVVVSPGAHS